MGRREVSKEDAKAASLYGFGGWLAVFYLLYFATLAATTYSYITDSAFYAQLFGPYVWASFESMIPIYLALSAPFFLMPVLYWEEMPSAATFGLWVQAAVYCALDVPQLMSGFLENAMSNPDFAGQVYGFSASMEMSVRDGLFTIAFWSVIGTAIGQCILLIGLTFFLANSRRVNLTYRLLAADRDLISKSNASLVSRDRVAAMTRARY